MSTHADVWLPLEDGSYLKLDASHSGYIDGVGAKLLDSTPRLPEIAALSAVFCCTPIYWGPKGPDDYHSMVTELPFMNYFGDPEGEEENKRFKALSRKAIDAFFSPNPMDCLATDYAKIGVSEKLARGPSYNTSHFPCLDSAMENFKKFGHYSFADGLSIPEMNRRLVQDFRLGCSEFDFAHQYFFDRRLGLFLTKAIKGRETYPVPLSCALCVSGNGYDHAIFDRLAGADTAALADLHSALVDAGIPPREAMCEGQSFPAFLARLEERECLSQATPQAYPKQRQAKL